MVKEIEEQEVVEELVPEEVKQPRNLVFAAYLRENREVIPIWGTEGVSPDKMKVSNKYSDQLTKSVASKHHFNS